MVKNVMYIRVYLYLSFIPREAKAQVTTLGHYPVSNS